MDAIDDALRVIASRLGEGTGFAALDVELKDAQGILVRVATPRTLYRMKKDTVRPIDHSDARALREAFGLDASAAFGIEPSLCQPRLSLAV